MVLEMTPDQLTQLLDSLKKATADGISWAVHVLWSATLSSLRANWKAVIILLFVAFVVFTIKAMMGRWGSLGSFLYNLFYFGTLFIIGLIWGPDVFLGDLFKAACTAILYPICYLLAGYVMDKMGVLD
jgi:hypothetical protein